MTDASHGQGQWLAQTGINHLSQLCASTAPSATPANKSSPDSNFPESNQAQVPSAKAHRREEHATNSNGPSEQPTKSKSGSDDDNSQGGDSNNNEDAVRSEKARKGRKSRQSEEPVINGSDRFDGTGPAKKARKTIHPAEQATNSGGSSDNTKSGSGDDECGGSNAGGSNEVGAAASPAPAVIAPPVEQGLMRLSSRTATIDVQWVTLQKVLLRMFTEDCINPMRNPGASARPAQGTSTGHGFQANSSSTSFKVDRTSSGDGYKWRKYGRKFLTFSRLNRDYYRCTYPGCPAKKHVEVIPDTCEVVTSGSTPHSHAPFAQPTGNSYKRVAPPEAPPPS